MVKNYLKEGKENAIEAKKLAEIMHINVIALNNAVKYERMCFGVPIAKCEQGYYIMTNAERMEKGCKSH